MPTFLAIRSGNVVDTLKGADPRGLTALLLRNDVILPPDVPNAALPFKEKGNVSLPFELSVGSAWNLLNCQRFYTRKRNG